MSTDRALSNITEIQAAPEPGFPPVHPGEVLGEAISEGLHLTVAETARRIGISRQMVHDILAGRRAVTAETALRFERLGAATARLLLRLQDEYDLAQARARLRDQLAAIEPVRAA
jgi:addiction module HigA family antidote